MRKLVSLCLAIFWLAASWPAYAGETMIHVGHNKLDPAEVVVAAGDSVVFHNLDTMPGGHTIVADDDSFESTDLGKNESWSHTFDEPGVYTYSIKQHPSAKGTITVE